MKPIVDTKSIPDWRKGHLTVSSLLSYWVLPLLLCVGCILDSPRQRTVLVTAATIQIVVSYFLCRMTTYLCLYEIPVALSTTLALLVHCASKQHETNHQWQYAFTLFGACVGLTVLKLTLGMSVALHRYASHAAFKCSSSMSTIVIVMGCLANQGGPLWWAANHRCHHKYCDLPKDPHSPTQVGFERAFAFYSARPELRTVNEEFVPRHIDTPLNRLLSSYSWVLVDIEMLLAWYYFGSVGLLLSSASAWQCLYATSFFNCVNHPDRRPEMCKATNYTSFTFSMDFIYFPLWTLLTLTLPFFVPWVGERDHETHHDFPRLAKRNACDMGYWLFVWPMQRLGLIWDVQLLDESKLDVHKGK